MLGFKSPRRLQYVARPLPATGALYWRIVDTLLYGIVGTFLVLQTSKGVCAFPFAYLRIPLH